MNRSKELVTFFMVKDEIFAALMMKDLRIFVIGGQIGRTTQTQPLIDELALD